jgi:hypothetical protein
VNELNCFLKKYKWSINTRRHFNFLIDKGTVNHNNIDIRAHPSHLENKQQQMVSMWQEGEERLHKVGGNIN